MMTSMKLPFILTPVAGESFLGFASRVAEANCFRSMRALFIALRLEGNGVLPKLHSAKDRLASVSQAFGVQPAHMEAMLPVAQSPDGSDILIHGMEMKDHHFLRNVRRVSPSGLQRGLHHRFSWQMFDLPFCTQTWEMLVEECPSPECRSTLTWRSPCGVHLCEDCGFDLRRAKTVKIEGEDRVHLQLLADLVSPDPLENQRAILPLHPDLRALNRGALLQLAVLFGRAEAALRGVSTPSEQKYLLAYPTIQAKGADLLRRYPTSLVELVASDVDGPTPPLIIKLKAMYATALTSVPKAFVARMMADLSQGRQPGLRGLAARRKEVNAMTTRAVAANLGIDNASVRRLVKNGHLTPTHIKGDSRQIDWFAPEAVEALARKIKDKISPAEIAGSFGLPQHAVEQFVQYGMLRWHPSPALSECFLGEFLMQSEVEALIGQLNAVMCLDDRASPRVPLSEVFATTGPTPKPWAPILEMARVGALPGGIRQVDPKDGLAAKNLTVDVSLFANVLRGQVPWPEQVEPRRHYCTQIEIEERLSIFPRDTSALIKAGIFRPVLPGSSKISRESMIEAATKYLSSSEIAARVGIKPAQVVFWAQRLAVEKPAGLPVWSRQSVEPFLRPLPLKYFRGGGDPDDEGRGGVQEGTVSPVGEEVSLRSADNSVCSTDEISIFSSAGGAKV